MTSTLAEPKPPVSVVEHHCANCGDAIPDYDDDLFQTTVNLTPDMLFIACNAYPFDRQLKAGNVGVNWCNEQCFASFLVQWGPAKNFLIKLLTEKGEA